MTFHPEGMTAYQETVVRRDQHRIHVLDHPGAGPPIILMRGFPDNLHLYDRLVPYLSPPRRVVLFDFLGWGSSDKPSGYPYTTANQVGDVDAVITQLGLEQVLLVAHEASGPPAIDWALAQPERVAGLVLSECPPCLLSLERGLIAHGQVTHSIDPQAEGVQAAGQDHFWRR